MEILTFVALKISEILAVIYLPYWLGCLAYKFINVPDEKKGWGSEWPPNWMAGFMVILVIVIIGCLGWGLWTSNWALVRMIFN